MKVYISEFLGVNCRQHRMNAFLEKTTATGEDCIAHEPELALPDGWSKQENDFNSWLEDESGRPATLVVNVKNGGDKPDWSSVSAVTSQGSTIITRNNPCK